MMERTEKMRFLDSKRLVPPLRQYYMNDGFKFQPIMTQLWGM
jgi:hypothetical protein